METPHVLLLDDGELDDIASILGELRIPFRRLKGVGTVEQPQLQLDPDGFASGLVEHTHADARACGCEGFGI